MDRRKSQEFALLWQLHHSPHRRRWSPPPVLLPEQPDLHARYVNTICSYSRHVKIST